MIEADRIPTEREVRVFGGLWCLFFAALGFVVLWKAAGLLGVAGVLAAAWLVAWVLEPENRGRLIAGVALPLLFAVSGGLVQQGVPAMSVAAAAWVTGIAGAVVIWAVPAAGRAIYLAWMFAAAPVGWTLSHLVLGAVYYVVLTPIGLIMRAAGRDPMRRGVERSARSYWIERKRREDPSRYFRQF